MTERRAARLGVAGALVLVGAQLGVAARWSLTHDDPTFLGLTRRCFEREKRLPVEATSGDPVAASASGGTLRVIVDGALVTIAIASSTREAARLERFYAADDPGERLDVLGRYVSLWLRSPSAAQRQQLHDCAY